MGKFFTWVIILAVVGIVAYGGWSMYNTLNPQIVQASGSALQTVRLSTGSVAAQVTATGQLRSNQSAQISWNDSGTVGALKVGVGSQVKAGDILGSLDPNALPDDILAAMTDLYSAQKALADLTQTQSTLPAAEKAVIDAQTAVDNAQSHRDMMNYNPRGNDQQIAQAQAAYLRALDAYNRAWAFYDKYPGDPTTELHNKAPALIMLEQAKVAYQTALSTINWYKGDWTPKEIATADSSLTVAKAKLLDAQTALAKVQKGPDPSQLAAAQHRIDVDNSIISNQVMTAPISGTITLANNKVGDLIKQGTVTFRIDDLSAYFVDLQVSEVDVARVSVGQVATITFDAIPNKTYNAAVTFVSPVGTTTNGVVNFVVTLQVTNPDGALKTGMTAQGNIVVGAVQNVLVVPSKAIKTVGSKNVVFVLSSVATNTTPVAGATQNTTGRIKAPIPGETETVVPVVVQLGISSDTSTQITSSRLQVGDLIVLNPPSSAISTAASSIQ